jgi:hypothetical protein
MTIEEHEHADTVNAYCSKKAQMHNCYATILSLCSLCISRYALHLSLCQESSSPIILARHRNYLPIQ